MCTYVYFYISLRNIDVYEEKHNNSSISFLDTRWETIKSGNTLFLFQYAEIGRLIWEYNRVQTLQRNLKTINSLMMGINQAETQVLCIGTSTIFV